jgi:hypothetical protein
VDDLDRLVERDAGRDCEDVQPILRHPEQEPEELERAEGTGE